MKFVRSFPVHAAFVLAMLIAGRPLMANDAPNATVPNVSPREKMALDKGWQFGFGGTSDPENDFAKTGADDDPASPAFNDSAWQQIAVPHDWNIARDPKNRTGWYRREITGIAKSDENARFVLDFDGVFGACEIWLNGYFVGRHDGGRAPFWFDISDYLDYGGGGRNVLAVRVAASSADECAGIDRRVRLTKTASLHVAKWSTFVRTEIVPSHASVVVQNTVQNDSDADAHCDVVWQVLDADGKQVALMVQSAQIPAHSSAPVESLLDVEHPQFWNLDAPHLYSLTTKVMQNGKIVDETRTPFGIRTIEFTANHQLLLNGKRVEIKTTSGDPADASAQMRSWLAAQKTAGANVYHPSHGAPAQELLDACDAMGILVIDENRYPLNEPAALDDLRAIMLRDRNHPCVILWSLGSDTENALRSPVPQRISAVMKRLASLLDSTRSVIDASDKEFLPSPAR